MCDKVNVLFQEKTEKHATTRMKKRTMHAFSRYGPREISGRVQQIHTRTHTVHTPHTPHALYTRHTHATQHATQHISERPERTTMHKQTVPQHKRHHYNTKDTKSERDRHRHRHTDRRTDRQKDTHTIVFRVTERIKQASSYLCLHVRCALCGAENEYHANALTS